MKIIKYSLIIISALALTYLGSWLHVAHISDKQINQFYTSNKNIMSGEKPELAGFPLTPVITYDNGIENDDLAIIFNQMSVKGYPIPYLPLKITFPEGIKITEKGNNKQVEFDNVFLNLKNPKKIPASFKENDLKTWQESVEKIEVTEVNISFNGAQITGSGYFGLDDNLQPVINLTTKIQGHQNLVNLLIEAGQIKPFAGALIISGMDALTQIDPDTNQKYVPMAIRMNNQTLKIGPLNLSGLPEIKWP